MCGGCCKATNALLQPELETSELFDFRTASELLREAKPFINALKLFDQAEKSGVQRLSPL